jgi:transketolase
LSVTTDRAALDELCVNTIRTLSMDAVQKANSGHPGTPMALAPLAYVLYTRVMRHSPEQPDWPGRDRFVLSCGHASMLLYSILHLTGYGISLDDIKHFRQLGSPCAGHPEYGHAPGIETTTGPLGQGISTAVGMALGERMLAARFEEFCAKHLPHLDEVAWEYFGGEAARAAVRKKVQALFPSHEWDHFTDHFWAEIQRWREHDRERV